MPFKTKLQKAAYDKLRYQGGEHRPSREKLIITERKYRSANIGKVRMWDRARHERDKEKRNVRRRSNYFKRTYGLSTEDYAAIVEKQKGRCAVCGDLCEKFDVDHDHKTKRIRGLACHSCNCTIGFGKDSPARLRAAAAYLEAFNV